MSTKKSKKLPMKLLCVHEHMGTNSEIDSIQSKGVKKLLWVRGYMGTNWLKIDPQILKHDQSCDGY